MNETKNGSLILVRSELKALSVLELEQLKTKYKKLLIVDDIQEVDTKLFINNLITMREMTEKREEKELKEYNLILDNHLNYINKYAKDLENLRIKKMIGIIKKLRGKFEEYRFKKEKIYNLIFNKK